MTDLLQQLQPSSLIALLAKASIILGLGLVVASMPRIGPALRHTILFAALCAAVALPLLSLAVPRWDVAILPRTREPQVSAEATSGLAAQLTNTDQPKANVPRSGRASAGASAAADARQTPARRATNFNRSIMTAVLAIWLLGTLLFAARLFVGRLKLRGIAARAWSPDEQAWIDLLDEEKQLARVSVSVRLLVSPAANTPSTWGTRNPVVLLPEDALEWNDDHRRMVLRHELGHIARGDARAHSIAALATAVYWFHPLARVAETRMRSECERACDDHVVTLGTEPQRYASHLLDVARATREMGSPGLLSLAMARPSQLHGRLVALLDTSRSREAPRLRTHFVAISFPLALAMVGSSLHPVPRTRIEAKQQEEIPERVAPRATVAPVATPMVELVAVPVAARDESLEDGQSRSLRNVQILLRGDLTLPSNAPVQLLISRDENLVLVNDTAAHPLDLRGAIELLKQIRLKYGREIPNGIVRISAPNRAPSTNPSDAEAYTHLINALLTASPEDINGRPTARHLMFEESAELEIAVSDSMLTKFINNSW